MIKLSSIGNRLTGSKIEENESQKHFIKRAVNNIVESIENSKYFIFLSGDYSLHNINIT